MNTVVTRMQRFGGISLEITLGIFLLWIGVAALNAPSVEGAAAKQPPTVVRNANAAKSLLALPGTICLQDDANGNTIQFDPLTGIYCFQSASGLTLSGTGTVAIKGSVVTLTHITPDRRITATYDDTTKRGKAGAQYFPSGLGSFAIADRNTLGSVCSCSMGT